MRVLQSYIGPGPRTNPYIVQLHDRLAATPGVAVRGFSWRTALLGRYDVFHAHWPEALIERRGRLSTLARTSLYALFLARASVQGIPIVRTVHNIELPSGIGRIERLLLAWTDRLTRMRILLNEFTPVPPEAATMLIEHGHYRDWFARFPQAAPARGRLLFFGKVRRYKNVEGLLRVFRRLADPTASLRIVGSPSSAELAQSLRSAAGDDPRVGLALDFVDDAELVREAGEAQVVVLPYPEMHNSGSVLAALSLDRAVLVPDNAFNRALADEVGSAWVIRFAGELQPSDLERALAETAAQQGRPDLGRREWGETGRRHLTAYRIAIRRRRG
ncbi:glycosyl transferase [Leucobacter triazinivorans]|uniref:glycosyl transferase n=1 Tax=Leucobacter triazinivorans TaxID=1784719 RepID=UPI001F0DE103|nr:glycosyl transferase [Leucobacter triazinivorans]